MTYEPIAPPLDDATAIDAETIYPNLNARVEAMINREPIAVGDELRIKFWDHVTGADDPIEFLVYGRVAKITPQAITLDSWANVDPATSRAHSETVETFSILRMVITRIDRAVWNVV
jgi:hypothetical protein